MNNILTFEDYKKMNIRQVESVIYHQFIEEDIKDEEIVNEGIIRNAINKASGKFIQTALADEIEKGKELEKSIKEALDGLNKGFDEIEKSINSDDDKKSKSKNISYQELKAVGEDFVHRFYYYQEIVEKIVNKTALPEVLDSVLQPHVEFYKKNLKGGVVVPGRIG